MRFVLLPSVVCMLVGTAVCQVDVSWANLFGGQGDDVGWDVISCSYQSSIVVGMKNDTLTGLPDGWVVCVDSSGVLDWQLPWGGPQLDGFRSICLAQGGGYLIAGLTCSFGAGEADAYLLRIPGTGPSFYWQKVFGGQGWDELRSVEMSVFVPGYIATGGTNSLGDGYMDVWLVKLFYSGDLEWENTYGGPGTDIGTAAFQINADGYIVFCTTNSYGAGDYDAWVIRTDAQGEVLWEKTFGGPSADYCTGAVKTYDNCYVICGYTTSPGSGDIDAWLWKIDDQGNVLWDRTYGGSLDDRAYTVCALSSQGYLVAGATASFGAGSDDVYLIRTDESGNLYWDYSYGGTQDDAAYSLCREGSGNSFITGSTSSWDAEDIDMLLIKTGSLMGVASPEDPEEGLLGILSVSSNPFQTSVTMDYSLTEPGGIETVVYDTEGRMQCELQDDFLEAGYHSVVWNGSDGSGTPLPDGQYFLVIRSRNVSVSAKVLLIR